MKTENFGKIKLKPFELKLEKGDSAYEVWLKQGHTGTEQDFLNSLKGTDGKDGLNGNDGKDGKGLPAEGNYGNIIIKSSDKDYDTKWLPFLYDLEGSPNVMPDSSSWVPGFIMENGTLYDSTNYMSTPYLVVPSGVLTVQYLNGATWSKRPVRSFACYDADKNCIVETVIVNPTATEITIPEGTAYIRISLLNAYVKNANYFKTMLVVNDTGELLGKYVGTGGTIKFGLNENIKITNKNLSNIGKTHIKSLNISDTSRKFEIHGDDNSSYIDVADFLAATSKTEWLYGLYDSLVETYPEYITKTLIAETATPAICYDKHGNERTDLKTGIPMYRYDFKPPIASRTINSTNVFNYTPELPKILYTGGIHGGEYLQTIATFRFFKALCDNWKNHDLLSCLRWNVHFVVIPITNPFAYEYPSGRYQDAECTIGVSKRNERNIDISGNFPSNNYVENEGTEYKYGTEPLTEPESIALYNIIQTEDFILSIDNHTFNCLSSEANTDKMIGYIIANQWQENSLDFWWKITRHLNERGRKLSPEIDDNYDMAQIWTDSRQQMLSNTFKGVGANVEMTLGIHPTDNTLLKEETQEFCVDELAVIFYEGYKDFWCYK